MPTARTGFLSAAASMVLVSGDDTIRSSPDGPSTVQLQGDGIDEASVGPSHFSAGAAWVASGLVAAATHSITPMAGPTPEPATRLAGRARLPARSHPAPHHPPQA
jgi:hypothetical protein